MVVFDADFGHGINRHLAQQERIVFAISRRILAFRALAHLSDPCFLSAGCAHVRQASFLTNCTAATLDKIISHRRVARRSLLAALTAPMVSGAQQPLSQYPALADFEPACPALRLHVMHVRLGEWIFLVHRGPHSPAEHACGPGSGLEELVHIAYHLKVGFIVQRVERWRCLLAAIPIPRTAIAIGCGARAPRFNIPLSTAALSSFFGGLGLLLLRAHRYSSH